MNIVKEECFTIMGIHELLDADGIPVTSDDKKMCAKSVEFDDGNINYYLKLNTENEPYRLENYTEYKNATARLITDIRFKKVNKEVFDAYKLYLKTNNKVFYKEVEKGLI